MMKDRLKVAKMTRRIIAISDAHYGLKSGGFDRTDEIHRVMNKAVAYAVGVGADLFIHCGDLGHVANPSSRIHGLWVELFEQLNHAQVESRFLLGNHDLVHRETNPSGSLSPLVELQYPFVRAVVTTGIEDLGGGVGVLWLPYMSKSNIPEKASVDEYNAEFLAANEAVLSGFDTVLVFSHLNPPEYQPHEDVILRPIHTTIPEAVMTGGWADLVVNGHIHRPQTVRRETPSVVVVGAPVCTDFGDVLKKSFLDIRVDSGRPVAINRVEAGNTPLVELAFDFVDQENPRFPGVETLNVEGAGVKVSVRATEDQIDALGVPEFASALQGVAEFVRPIIPMVVRRRKNKGDAIVRPDMTDADAVRAWLEDRQPSGTKVILKCGLEALENAGA